VQRLQKDILPKIESQIAELAKQDEPNDATKAISKQLKVIEHVKVQSTGTCSYLRHGAHVHTCIVQSTIIFCLCVSCVELISAVCALLLTACVARQI